MEELKITVTHQTAETMQKIAEWGNIPIGEVVDRMMLQVAPQDPKVAFVLILEHILISISNLSEKGVTEFFGDLGALLFLLIPSEELDELVSRIKNKEYAEKYDLSPLTIEERTEIVNAIRDTLFSSKK